MCSQPLCILVGLMHKEYLLQAGMYILQLMDSYAPSYGLLVVGLCECLVIAYVYGE